MRAEASGEQSTVKQPGPEVKIALAAFLLAH